MYVYVEMIVGDVIVQLDRCVAQEPLRSAAHARSALHTRHEEAQSEATFDRLRARLSRSFVYQHL